MSGLALPHHCGDYMMNVGNVERVAYLEEGQ
jgi:hypothetical protein